MKRLVAFVLAAALLLVPSVAPVSAEVLPDTTSAITVKLDDHIQSFDQPPVVLNGNTMVPLRGLLETLGATVLWDDATQTVSAIHYTTKGRISVVLRVGSPLAIVNDTSVALDQPPEVINGRTMVPLRFVSESMRAAVTWIEASKTVEIYSLDYQLFISSIRGHVELVNKTLELGANPNYRNADKGDTSLTAAVLFKHSDIVTLLLSNGANINAQDADGYTALMMAVNNDDLDMSALLLSRGADDRLQSKSGLTALQYAEQDPTPNPTIIKLLQIFRAAD